MKKGGNKEEGCIKCGTCNTVCPVYLATGNEVHTPRGKQHLRARLQKGERSGHFAEIFSQCLLCGGCLEVCPRGLDTPSLVVEVRSELPRISGLSFLKYLSRRALEHPQLLSSLVKAGKTANELLGDILPAESGLRLRLIGFQQQALQPPPESYISKTGKKASEEGGQHRVNYFTGCLANHLQTEIAESTQFLVSRATGSEAVVPSAQTCCGMAALAAGRADEARKLARNNIIAFESNDLPILTSCSSCYFQLKNYGELFAGDAEWQERANLFTERLREFSSFFLQEFSGSDGLGAGSSVKKVFYHDPCHLRFKLHITREPRQLLGLFESVELVELQDGPKCCGHGGLFQVAHPDLALQVRENIMDEYDKLAADAITPDTVVTACSGCLLQWQSFLAGEKKDEKALHLAIFLAGLLE